MALDLRKHVAVVGVGCTPFGELYDKSAEDLLCDAVDEALADAGCARERIEAGWVGTVLSPFGGDGLADALKLFGRPMTRVQNYCASGMDAFRKGVGNSNGRVDRTPRYQTFPPTRRTPP